MDKKSVVRSHCPINFALEAFGDAWSLLIIRDIIFWGKKTYGEFLDSKEGIASNILAGRLTHLVNTGLLTKEQDKFDKRKIIYRLTDKGLDLIPMVLEMAGWATRNDADTTSPREFVEYIFKNREKMFTLIRKTIKEGGSLFVGDNCVVKKISA